MAVALGSRGGWGRVEAGGTILSEGGAGGSVGGVGLKGGGIGGGPSS